MTKIANLAARIKAGGNPLDNEQVLTLLAVAAQELPPGRFDGTSALDIFKHDLNAVLGSYFQNALDLVAALDEPVDGTHAFTLIAASEKAHLDTIESLISLTVATVLSNLVDQEGGGRINMTISPKHMSDMLDRYTMTATRDGMATTVTLTPIEGAFGDDMAFVLHTTPAPQPIEPGQIFHAAAVEAQPDNLPPTAMHTEMSVETLDVSDAKPQADPKPERPLWGYRRDGHLSPVSDKATAEDRVRAWSASYPDSVVQVENRFCYHETCPAEHCNKEVTSETVDKRDA